MRISNELDTEEIFSVAGRLYRKTSVSNRTTALGIAIMYPYDVCNTACGCNITCIIKYRYRTMGNIQKSYK